MKSFFLRAWMGWERLFEKIFGIVYISDDNIFRVALRVYRGKAIQLSDGTVLKGGDKYIELHFNNEVATRVLKDVNPMAMLNWVRSSLVGLARFIKEGPYAKADVIMGFTIFSVKGIERFGFEIMELNRVERRVMSLYERFLYTVFHGRAKGKKAGGKVRKMTARRVLISRKKLLELYGDVR